MLKLVKLQSLVAKCCKMRKIKPSKICKFCILLYCNFRMQYKSIQNLKTLQGYTDFPYFTTFRNQTLQSFTYFSMLFLAVVIYLHQGEAIYFEARCGEVRTSPEIVLHLS